MTVTRECGRCSMCCKLLYIREIGKPIDTWCKHCAPGKGGCAIHADRPSECRDFICGWLEGVFVDDAWYPARCKMIASVLKSNKALLFTVDPAFPDAWRREPYYSTLLTLAKTATVTIRVGLRLFDLMADGEECEAPELSKLSRDEKQAFIEGRSAEEAHPSAHPRRCGGALSAQISASLSTSACGCGTRSAGECLDAGQRRRTPQREWRGHVKAVVTKMLGP